jgi:hypothetical protein
LTIARGAAHGRNERRAHVSVDAGHRFRNRRRESGDDTAWKPDGPCRGHHAMDRAAGAEEELPVSSRPARLERVRQIADDPQVDRRAMDVRLNEDPGELVEIRYTSDGTKYLSVAVELIRPVG